MPEQPKLDRFNASIEALGETNKARASALGISDRQLWNWQNGRLPKTLIKIPSKVLRALAEDIEQKLSHQPDQAA